MTIEQWKRNYEQLVDAPSGDAADDLIEEALKVCNFDTTAEYEINTEIVAQYWRYATSKATADLTSKDAALFLAKYAAADDDDAVDLLVRRYKDSLSAERTDYLSPQYITALYILAMRNSLAETEMLSLLQRIKPSVSRHLVVRAAKIIASYELRRSVPTDALRAKLTQWTEANDVSVQAEALYQNALLSLNDALQSDDLATLDARFADCRVAFRQAEECEEIRDDAKIYLALIDLLRLFPVIDGNAIPPQDAIRQASTTLRSTVFGAERAWRGMTSKTEEIAQFRVLNIANAMVAISESTSKASEWTNFEEALTEIGALFLLIRRSDDVVYEENSSNGLGFSRVADPVALTHFGPLINRVVERVRFDKVITKYVMVNGEDEVAKALRDLRGAAAAREFIGVEAFTPEALEAIFQESLKSPETLAFFLCNFPTAQLLFAERIPENFRNHDALLYLFSPLPVDYPDCYGNDPTVDATVLKIFYEARQRLGTGFSHQKWNRFKELTIFLVTHALLLRDSAPAFTICSEDKGKGQNATEQDLQDNLEQALKQKFGRKVHYEASRIVGGRADLIVEFDECHIPIEVKREFNDISRSHVTDTFLRQGTAYSSARDGLVFLLVLDLRPENSSGHVDRLRAARVTAKATSAVAPTPPPAYKPYTLKDSFWATGLPVDPQITEPELDVVVVGLFPGNRTKPSSNSTYSQK